MARIKGPNHSSKPNQSKAKQSKEKQSKRQNNFNQYIPIFLRKKFFPWNFQSSFKKNKKNVQIHCKKLIKRIRNNKKFE